MDIDPRFLNSEPDSEIGMQFGECAQNLKSALDMLESVVRTNGAGAPVIEYVEGLGDHASQAQIAFVGHDRDGS